MSEPDLLFPIYINQRAVFDFVATMQDGISTVTRTRTTEGEEAQDKREIGGSFGLGAALSNFFKIDARAGRESGSKNSVQTEEAQEKYQTPTSLLARLLTTLRANQKLRAYTTVGEAKVGQLIEFQAVLTKNPMVETLEAALQGFEMFVGAQQAAAAGKGQKAASPKLEPGVELGLKLSKTLLRDIEGSLTTDIVSSPLVDSARAVLSLERAFLSDPSMTNLLEGEFRVFAKVIRVMPSTSDKLNLLRNSTVGKLQGSVVQPVLDAVGGLKSIVNVSDPPLEICGPLIHVLPIAIYA